jgi:drug/metabolite transporter (DMT)-like permease
MSVGCGGSGFFLPANSVSSASLFSFNGEGWLVNLSAAGARVKHATAQVAGALETKRRRATVIGLLATVSWAMMFGFMRQTSVAFGEYLGPALVYTIAAAVVFVVYRPSPVRRMPLIYVLAGGGMFIAYEAAVAVSVGLASTSQQTLEVSLVNYLWPSLLVLVGALVVKFRLIDRRPGASSTSVRAGGEAAAPTAEKTVVAKALADGEACEGLSASAEGSVAKAVAVEDVDAASAVGEAAEAAPKLARRSPRRGIIRRVLPGVLVATVGVVVAVGGNNGLDFAAMSGDIAANPAPFALCLVGACIWAVYSSFVGHWSKGADATAYFLGGVAVVMWTIFALRGAPAPAAAPALPAFLSLVGAAASIGIGYAFWGYGMNHGNFTLISIGSYAAPLLSVIASVIILGVRLTPIFWIGTVCVVAGSFINWRMRR